MSERKGDPAVDGLRETLLPHLDAAYNLARWLLGNGEEAKDIVQEAYLRALQHAAGFRGGDERPWLLAIVRHTAYSWLRKTRAHAPFAQFDEEIHTNGDESSNPEPLMLRGAEIRRVEEALSQLPVRFREVLVLREIEGLSYKQISDVMGVTMGTVMSRLSRARDRFREAADNLLNSDLGTASGAKPASGPVGAIDQSLNDRSYRSRSPRLRAQKAA